MSKYTARRTAALLTAATLCLATSTAALAAGEHAEGHDGQSGAATIGQPGQASRVDRTVAVEMGDTYFKPERIRVEAGETVRFELRNVGRMMHEFAIGTPAMHRRHQAEMAAMTGGHDETHHGSDHAMHGGAGMHAEPAMPHDQAEMHHADDHHGGGHHGGADNGGGHHQGGNIVMLQPGAEGELIWRFPDAGTLEFACNIPGHYQAGMHGRIKLER